MNTNKVIYCRNQASGVHRFERSFDYIIRRLSNHKGRFNFKVA